MSDMNCRFCGDRKKFVSAVCCDKPGCFSQWSQESSAAQNAALADPRVAAIRNDEAVGVGSCSVVDECMDNCELLEVLKEEKIKTPYDAVVWARKRDVRHWERGLDQLFGDDSPTDLEIKACVKESRERAELPILASREEVKED